jgi:ATP-dependent Zn protease
MLEKSWGSWAKWKAVDREVATAALGRIASEVPVYFQGTTLVTARQAVLPFYQVFRLLELELRWQSLTERAWLLDGDGRTLWLSGASSPMHDANHIESLELGEPVALDYLRYFLQFLRADEGAFVPVERPEELVATEHDDAWFQEQTGTLDFEVLALWTQLRKARDQARPLASKGRDEEGRFLFEGTIAYGSQLAQSVFAVSPSGLVEMVSDTPIMTLEGLSVAGVPDLELAGKLAAEGDTEPPPPDEEGGAAVEASEEPAKEGPPAATKLRTRPTVSAARAAAGRDRDVTEAVVTTLLEEAVRARADNQLLEHFNSEAQADDPIDRLASMVIGSVPIITIESDIPFVEEFVLGLLEKANEDVTAGPVQRNWAFGGDDTKLEVKLERERVSVYLLSFHAYRSLWDAERVANELAVRDAAVLIGADRQADVPEPLRRVTDLVLKFPRIDRKVFARIFERVFGVKPAPGWEGVDADWTRYLVPADFHTPRRLGLDPAMALRFLRERVATRLRVVSAESAPRLADLHGMGEARQVAEDLIADVRAAQAGQVPWSSVDRGFLLVGRPGTGKTTLARAVAKECGIKFLVASAASWQAAGFLDAHLRAMRADFTEARRFAPSILFIDELDSIGNRELLSGYNVQYQTEVINSLLEQVQGFDVSSPVIVIGATNYIEKVDPALRRAGRLDQVISIPLPSIPSLEQIFQFHLESYRRAGEVGSDVVERHLAELALGLTGADVEFFVRGAARRARREGRQIGQADLLAEVTRRPRRPDSAPRLEPASMRRVAVHEAGHAVASLTAATAGAELTFVTIVPRTDGSLGFVASLPDAAAALTRPAALEELEMLLAGRGAEEVVYGPADIGLGAGGPSERSDLAAATGLATMLVCQAGSGGDRSLHWTRTPTPAQEKQIDKLLRASYRAIVTRLRAHRPLLERVAALLVEQQEISGAELRSLVVTGAERRGPAGKAPPRPPSAEGAPQPASPSARPRPRRSRSAAVPDPH